MTSPPVNSPAATPPGRAAAAVPVLAVPVLAVPVLTVLAVTVLAGCTVAWAAVPVAGARAGARPVLVAAVACAVLSVVKLAAAKLAARPGAVPQVRYLPPVAGFAVRSWSGLRAVPWAEGMTVAVLGLEALRPSRPWHTVVLGVALLGFLLALHLAESAAGPAVLRPQLPLIVAGIGLCAVSAGAAMLPATGGLLAVIAAVAAVAVAAIAVPV